MEEKEEPAGHNGHAEQALDAYTEERTVRRRAVHGPINRRFLTRTHAGTNMVQLAKNLLLQVRNEICFFAILKIL